MSALLEKARELAEDARSSFNGGRFNSACSRAYYAMFNAARALLETRGHSPEAVKSHASVLRLFSLEFVRQGPFDAEDGRALRIAAKARNTADYDRSAVTAPEARAVIASLDRFFDTVERTIQS